MSDPTAAPGRLPAILTERIERRWVITTAPEELET